MNWYQRLHAYFPENEMKDKQQLMDLIDEKDVYHKEETDDYLILYAEFPTFIFIDYFIVNPINRGKGIGTQVLQKFKQRGKPIILEVEPIDPEDQDTQKRVQFYEKNGFKRADRIEYKREDESGENYYMNILYWSPEPLLQSAIMEKMAKACQEIHNFRSKQYYGRLLADPQKVLHWKH